MDEQDRQTPTDGEDTTTDEGSDLRTTGEPPVITTGDGADPIPLGNALEPAAGEPPVITTGDGAT